MPIMVLQDKEEEKEQKELASTKKNLHSFLAGTAFLAGMPILVLQDKEGRKRKG